MREIEDNACERMWEWKLPLSGVGMCKNTYENARRVNETALGSWICLSNF